MSSFAIRTGIANSDPCSICKMQLSQRDHSQNYLVHTTAQRVEHIFHKTCAETSIEEQGACPTCHEIASDEFLESQDSKAHFLKTYETRLKAAIDQGNSQQVESLLARANRAFKPGQDHVRLHALVYAIGQRRHALVLSLLTHTEIRSGYADAVVGTARRNNDEEALLALMPHVSEYFRREILEYAVRKNQIPFLERVLSLRISLPDRELALKVAAYWGADKSVTTLLSKEPFSQEVLWKAIDQAYQGNQYAIVENILHSTAPVIGGEITQVQQLSQQALLDGQLKIARLLDEKFHVNFYKHQKTAPKAFILAAERGQVDMLTFLQSNVSDEIKKEAFIAGAKNGKTETLAFFNTPSTSLILVGEAFSAATAQGQPESVAYFCTTWQLGAEILYQGLVRTLASRSPMLSKRYERTFTLLLEHILKIESLPSLLSKTVTMNDLQLFQSLIPRLDAASSAASFREACQHSRNKMIHLLEKNIPASVLLDEGRKAAQKGDFQLMIDLCLCSNSSWSVVAKLMWAYSIARMRKWSIPPLLLPLAAGSAALFFLWRTFSKGKLRN